MSAKFPVGPLGNARIQSQMSALTEGGLTSGPRSIAVSADCLLAVAIKSRGMSKVNFALKFPLEML